MERFPRGSIPPSQFRAIATVAPHAVARPEEAAPCADLSIDTPQRFALLRGPTEQDLSITCPTCAIDMQPEHAHYKCPKCGYRDSCCF